MMKTLQNIWKHKREFQINIFMVIGIDKFQFVEQNKVTPDRPFKICRGYYLFTARQILYLTSKLPYENQPLRADFQFRA